MHRTKLAGLFILLAACSGGGTEPLPAETPEEPESSTAATTSTLPGTTLLSPVVTSSDGAPAVVLTPRYGGDGNSVADLRGPFATEPTTETLRAARVVRIDIPSTDGFAVVYEDGEVRVADETSNVIRERTSAGATGLVFTSGPGGLDLLAPFPDQAPHSRPAVLPGGLIAYVTPAGDVVLWGQREIGRAAVDALPDGDVLTDDRGRLLVLTGPSDRYPHSILGDPIEATGFTILDPAEMTPIAEVSIGEPAVIEGRRAMWVDFDGDGAREIQVTVSDSAGGARLAVFEESGEIAAEGSAIGRSNRWRHQIAFGDFGAERMGVEVVTPHIGGIVTFNEYGTEISRVATSSQYTSHGIGSRDLDGAVAIDIDGNGTLELLLPSQDRRELVAIGLVSGQAEVVWRAEVDSTISSNVAVGARDGRPTIAVGTADGTIYFWSAVR